MCEILQSTIIENNPAWHLTGTETNQDRNINLKFKEKRCRVTTINIFSLKNKCLGPEVRGTRPVLVTFENFKDRDEVLRKVSGYELDLTTTTKMRTYRPDQKYVIQARMLKKANVHVEEDLSKRTRENRAELRKFMRQV